jgi:DNA-binding XRE family transcriptional regulator
VATAERVTGRRRRGLPSFDRAITPGLGDRAFDRRPILPQVRTNRCKTGNVAGGRGRQPVVQRRHRVLTGAELKVWRKRHGLKQGQEAAQLTVSRYSILRAEKQPSEPLSTALAAKLRHAGLSLMPFGNSIEGAFGRHTS